MLRVSTTGRLLRRLVQGATARPAWTLAGAVALAALAVGYSLHTLALRMAIRDLFPKGLPYVERWVEYEREFGELDDIAVVIEAPSPPEAKEYAARLVREIRQARVPVNRIAYRIDPKQFEGRALLYLSRERLEEIRDRIFQYQDFMEAFAARPTLDQLVRGVSTQVATALAAGFLDLGLSGPRGADDVRFVREVVGQMTERLDRPTPYRSPWGTLFLEGDVDEAGAGYFLSDDQRLLFILAQPAQRGDFTVDRQAVAGIRDAVERLRPAFPAVRAGVTGKPALSSDEMTATFRDSERATMLAFALTLGLLLLAFLRVAKPLVMLAVLALSLCWSVGVAALVIGHFSLFSIMFISIVIGIGIDYGIYFLFRYEEERFLGRGLREALAITAARSGPGMLLGAVTAAATFYVLMLTEFRGIQELGFVAGTAILLAFVATITVFPAALVLMDRRHASAPAAIPRAIRLESVHVPLVDWITRHPRTVVTAAALLTAGAVWSARGVSFDYNLLNLQAAGTESVVWERRIRESASRSGFAALASAHSLDELRRKQEAFLALPSVSEVDSALLMLPDQQGEKMKVIADFAALVAPLRVARPQPVDVPQLLDELATLRRRLGIGAAEAPEGPGARDLRRAMAEIDRLVEKLERADPDVSEPSLARLQQQVYRDFVRNFQRLQANLNPRPVRLQDLPPEIHRKFVSESGRFLMQIHPSVDTWEREGAEAFVRELRSVDPDITGSPIITYESIATMERGYRQGTIYAVVLVTLMTLAMLRRVRETALALLPLALGLVWTAGIMPLLGLQLTLGNALGLPLILGAAAEYGLNIVIRFMEGRRDGGAPLVARSTVMAVLVNGLTTMAGFGSLMLAEHRGIFGLGLLLTVGTAAALLAALVVLPVLLRLLPRPAAPPAPAAHEATLSGRPG